MGVQLLEKELKTYEENRSELVKRHNGEYVLIKKDKIIAFYNDESESDKTRVENVWPRSYFC